MMFNNINNINNINNNNNTFISSPNDHTNTPDFLHTAPFTEAEYTSYNNLCRQFMGTSTTPSSSSSSSSSTALSFSATPTQVSPISSPRHPHYLIPHQPHFTPGTATIGSAPGARTFQLHIPRSQVTTTNNTNTNINSNINTNINPNTNININTNINTNINPNTNININTNINTNTYTNLNNHRYQQQQQQHLYHTHMQQQKPVITPRSLNITSSLSSHPYIASPLHQIPIGYERKSSFPSSAQSDMRGVYTTQSLQFQQQHQYHQYHQQQQKQQQKFASPTGRYWANSGISPPVSPCAAPLEFYGTTTAATTTTSPSSSLAATTAASGDRWVDDVTQRKNTLVTHEMAVAAARVSNAASPMVSPRYGAGLGGIGSGLESFGKKAASNESDNGDDDSDDEDDDDDDDLPFGMAASKAKKPSPKVQARGYLDNGYADTSRGFSLFEDLNGFDGRPVKLQQHVTSPNRQQQHVTSPLQPRVQIKYSSSSTHIHHIPVQQSLLSIPGGNSMGILDQQQQHPSLVMATSVPSLPSMQLGGGGGGGNSITLTPVPPGSSTTPISSPIQRKYAPMTYRRPYTHSGTSPPVVPVTSPTNPVQLSNLMTLKQAPQRVVHTSNATNTVTLSPTTSVATTNPVPASSPSSRGSPQPLRLPSPRYQPQNLNLNINLNQNLNINQNQNQNQLQNQSQPHNGNSPRDDCRDPEVPSVTSASISTSSGGGGGGGGGNSTRLATATRQRAKQALKAMRSDQVAQTGRDDLRTLAAAFFKGDSPAVAAAVAAAGGNGERWALLLELADMAKRENEFELARALYRKAIRTKPKKSLCWLEYAKMEDECGDPKHCLALLQRGLANCPLCESMMIKAIKTEEKLQNLGGARALLALLKDQPLEKTWRIVLEGALLEARCGNAAVARCAFRYLMRNVPWYGPIYQEAFRFEERYEEYARAIRIVEQGLKENAKYGPLWFSAIRIYEKVASPKLAPTLAFASEILLKDLKWKVFFEQAQIEARAGRLREARAAYVRAADHCPSNLVWKVWFGGARTELCAGNVARARDLIAQALASVPVKMRPIVVLDQSRLEEYSGNVRRAREILDAAKSSERQEWKIFLERILLEIRARDKKEAFRQTLESLHVHTGTGRLWALKIQLIDEDPKKVNNVNNNENNININIENNINEYNNNNVNNNNNEESINEYNEKCINENSKNVNNNNNEKSINEYNKSILEKQMVVFKEALREVPKSGEVWCEGARIYIKKGEHEDAKMCLKFAVQFTPQYGDSFIEYLRNEFIETGKFSDPCPLERQCINAEPNYGPLWLYCKKKPLDSPREVLRTAREMLKAGTLPDATEQQKHDYERLSDVNVMYFSSPNLSDTERFKLVYGCDILKS